MSREGTVTSPVRKWLMIAAVMMAFPITWLIVMTIDRSALERVWRSVLGQPLEVVAVMIAFGGAFLLRAVAWRRVLPDLPLGHALAALHVSLAGNHILPLRMGEPLRVVSIVRRAGISWERATASTVTLRGGDVVAILALGVAVGMGRFPSSLLWLAAGASTGAVVVGLVWLARLRSRGTAAAFPGPVVVVTTLGAWLLESVVVWQAGAWAGLPITFDQAVLATAGAILAQVAAVAPGGIGNYEAGGTAALVLAGHDPATSLAVIVTAHAIKTVYSLLGGTVASALPAPGLFGRFRLPRPPVPAGSEAPGSGPVVLFMPAHDEEASVGRVIERVPTHVQGRRVICVVVDDGSTDRTGAMALQAGAHVISLPYNQGLGAAVRRGIEASLQLQPSAVVFCDADGEYAPEELDALVKPILDGEADYVVGSRFAGEIRRMLPHRRAGNWLLTRLLSWVARRTISDGQSGYRAFSPAAARAAEIIHDFNYAQVLTLDLLAKGMRYREVPISYSFRTTGKSFVRLGRYLRAVVPAVYREVNAA